MMGEVRRDPAKRLSLNIATIKAAPLPEALEVAVAAGWEAVGLWRDRVEEVGLGRAVRLVESAGLRVSSLCRGGFLTATDGGGQRAALEDNRRAIDQAAALGAPELVMVVGGLPPGDKNLTAARQRVGDRLVDLVTYAVSSGVRLALEPLHPMYVADRAVLTTLRQALALAAPFPSAAVGVVVDTFHVFWDPEVYDQIRHAGAEGRISSYQVCDFNLPIAADALLSRGMMGDGIIDFASLTAAVSAAGYVGDVEVEIFNRAIWAQPPAPVLVALTQRYQEFVAPYL